ncbi:hypothetical protein, partial [uncultured Duncaniella sp.]|uniref:hypothetical protein n=1 Tax=uncultured Duncaniella sp. TaxID=2768039 RepID=UPI0025A9D307
GRNIVKDSHPDKETTEYTLALLEYTEELAVGDIITITLFGELGSQKEYLQAIHNGGDGTRGATRLSKISDGIYRGNMVIKSTFPIYYTSHPQSAEKGVRHERQDNADDRIHTAFALAERACKARVSDKWIRLERLYPNGILHDGYKVRRNSGKSPTRTTKKRAADCTESLLSGADNHSRLFGRLDSLPHKMVQSGFPRLARNRNLENRHVNIARRKEVVAA